MAGPPATRLGTFRSHFFGFFICLAGFLFGYDTGIVGGVLVMPAYKAHFRYTDQTTVSAVMVSLQSAAAFLAAVFIFTFSERFGRRTTIMASMALFCAGVILQVVPSRSLTCFYLGRIISGLGLGAATATVPAYNVEMAPKEIRGRLGSGVQLLFTFGVMISYWVTYACKVGLPTSARQWQIPVGLQLIPSAVLGFGMLYFAESVRWLAKKGRNDEAWASLTWIRASDDPGVKAEFNEIQVGIAEELRASEGFRSKELLQPANRNRLVIAFGLFLSQQCAGMTALAFFGPQVFSLLVGNDVNRSLLITGLFGAQKVMTCLCYVVFFSELWRRKPTLWISGILMAISFTIVTVVNKTTPAPYPPGTTTSSGIATVAMIFVTNSIYQFSWGPLPWVVSAEIFPSRIREIGTSTAVSTQWLFNFLFSLVTPYMVRAWGSYVFIFYAALDLCMALFAFIVLEETKGRFIEEMETIFHSNAAFDVHTARQQGLSKDVDDFIEHEQQEVGIDKHARAGM